MKLDEEEKLFSENFERKTLHIEIIHRLRHMIFTGELLDGSRVPEKKLCERFNISRTPLREALKVLATEGSIELLPNRGARISRLVPEDIDEVFPVIAALDALAGELAVKNISDTEITEIKAMHYQMALHHVKGERHEYFSLNQKIHQKILETAKNPTLVKAYNSLSGRLRRARYNANISQERWDQAMKEHEFILSALVRRDGETLSKLLRTHLLNKSESIKIAIQTET